MDRVAIVTGATGGIGRATAIRRCTRADSSEKTPSVSAEADNALGSDRDRLKGDRRCVLTPSSLASISLRAHGF